MAGLPDQLDRELAKIKAQLEKQLAEGGNNALQGQKQAKLPTASAQGPLDAVQLSLERLPEFHFLILGQVQCPQCFLVDGIQSSLRQETFIVGSATRVYTCPRCHYDLKVTN